MEIQERLRRLWRPQKTRGDYRDSGETEETIWRPQKTRGDYRDSGETEETMETTED